MRRKGVIAIVVLAVIAGLVTGVWAFWSKREKATLFHTIPVRRGDIVATISATGTIEPAAAVDVGAQVAGVIVSFGKDKRGKEVNWGSEVDAGTVLAKIDDSLYVAAVKTAEAQVQQAQANIPVAEANVLQQKANLLLATQNWERAQRLGPSDALAQSAYDQYKDTYEVGKANLASALAAVDTAKAALAAAKASLLTARINLDYCTIKSPAKGVIIDRRVNIGQTVVSSLSAPSLFLISSDLKHTMQVWISVNEADVGNIHEGQPVRFTVDAFPGQVFHGKVGQVRLNATMTQNVVTYTIEIDTDNSEGRLLPYLTANAQFEIGRRQGVLLVPNAALRFTPKPGEIAPEAKQARGSRRGISPEQGGERGTIWIAQGKFVRPLPVKAGLTDGAFTEVEGARLAEGLPVVVGEGVRGADAASTAERNPFAPQMPFRGNRPAQGQTEGTQAPGQENQGQQAPTSRPGQ